jgi:hypothetical protein
MAYNISEVSGDSVGSGTASADVWTFAADIADPSITTVSGDFDVVPIGGGAQSEATDGYTFGGLSTTQWGTLSFNTVTGTFTFTINRAAIFASGSDQTVTFTVIGRSGGSSDDDTVQINILICVARGTLVATSKGEIGVEDLRPGDLVLTADGRAEPVRWIGSPPSCRRGTRGRSRAAPRLYFCRRLGPGPPLSRPSRVAATQGAPVRMASRASLRTGARACPSQGSGGRPGRPGRPTRGGGRVLPYPL